ncbi:hypothetical protein METP3_03024 [Methanosarcinales archaeon]|nr:hypothetical protein METP3_03024 [Methanosarcinales archaeon]
MTVRRMVLQAAVASLTQNQAITVDANGLLISAGLLSYAYIQNVSATDKLLGRVSVGAGSIEEIACTAAGRAILDDADAAAQRTTLGLGTIATQAANSVSISGGAISGITDLAVADGGTGSSTAAAARLALGLVDANDRIPRLMNSAIYRSGFIGNVASGDITVVAGSFAQTNDANATDFDDLWVTQAGHRYNSTTADLDEFKISGLVLNAGTYVIKVVCVKNADGGILEVLHGTTSLGTYDQYNAGTSYNQIASFTYSPTTRVSADLRFRCNGKHASSSDYVIRTSRIQIMKTA